MILKIADSEKTFARLECFLVEGFSLVIFVDCLNGGPMGMGPHGGKPCAQVDTRSGDESVFTL